VYPLVDSDMLEWGSHCISFVDGKLTDGRLTSDSRHQGLRNGRKRKRVSSPTSIRKYFGNRLGRVMRHVFTDEKTEPWFRSCAVTLMYL